MRHGGSRCNPSGSAGLWFVQPHHQHAPEDVWTGSRSSGRHRLNEIQLWSFRVTHPECLLLSLPKNTRLLTHLSWYSVMHVLCFIYLGVQTFSHNERVIYGAHKIINHFTMQWTVEIRFTSIVSVRRKNSQRMGFLNQAMKPVHLDSFSEVQI